MSVQPADKPKLEAFLLASHSLFLFLALEDLQAHDRAAHGGHQPFALGYSPPE